MSTFQPSPEILAKYAKVLVDFALNSGQGVKKGEVVRLSAAESAKPLFVAIRNQLLLSGAFPISDYAPDDVSRQFYELANSDQLKFFPAKYLRGLINQIDHSIHVISETNLHELEGIDPSKIMIRRIALKPFHDWQDTKENAGKFTWTLGLYGTDAMAKEAGMSIGEYWNQIIKACFLDSENPVEKWRQVSAQNNSLRNHLNSLSIEKLHIQGPDVDLFIQIGPNRKWLGGNGCNIPSFEIFISPNWRGTNGRIKFNQPLYHYGNLITGIELEFANGVVTKSSATKNYQVLKKMLEVKNADKLGEFSLTDNRLSRIDHFMAETLYDENISGPFGNTHIALGASFKDSFVGDQTTVSKTLWSKYCFNDSAIHTDIISTSDRTVTAYLSDGSQKIIYTSGRFTFPL
jgi:aminopeptidase